MLGSRVRERRTALGFSQENLAHRAGVSLNAVHKLEAGRITDPHFSTLSGIAHALGMTVAELVGEEVHQKAPARSELPQGSEAGQPSDEEQAPIEERVWARINLLKSAAVQWERLVGEGHYKLDAPNLETLKTIDAVTANVVINHAYDAALIERAATDVQRARLDQAKRRMFGAYQRFWYEAEKHLSDTQPHSVIDLQEVIERRKQSEQFSASDHAGSQAG